MSSKFNKVYSLTTLNSTRNWSFHSNGLFRDVQNYNSYNDFIDCFFHSRNGHALMAFRLSRVSAPLSPEKTIELGHHVLKAHIYKNISRQMGYSSRDMQAYWMSLSSHCLSTALVSHRNIYSPNIKVQHLSPYQFQQYSWYADYSRSQHFT